MVKNIGPSTSGSNPSHLANAGGTLVFNADDQSIAGFELWGSDGTSTGTTLVADINPTLEGSNPTELTWVAPILFFFVATDGATGRELWAYAV